MPKRMPKRICNDNDNDNDNDKDKDKDNDNDNDNDNDKGPNTDDKDAFLKRILVAGRIVCRNCVKEIMRLAELNLVQHTFYTRWWKSAN